MGSCRVEKYDDKLIVMVGASGAKDFAECWWGDNTQMRGRRRNVVAGRIRPYKEGKFGRWSCFVPGEEVVVW